METRGGDNNTHNHHSGLIPKGLTKELAKIEADKK
jgi:hypothetical protein